MTGPLILLAVLGVSALLMRIMWRQMRKVNAHTAEVRRRAEATAPIPPVAGPGYEEMDPVTGQYVAHTAEVNPELIRAGARARSAGWFYDP